jgi:hypothetical protein
MNNLLFAEIDYKYDETDFGRWRRFLKPDGQLFEEFVSHRHFGDWPLLHYTRGRCPETGKTIVARGVIAIGRRAVGVIAVGQLAVGVFAVGQLAVGLLFGLGQVAMGMFALGQLAVAGIVGLGQLATGCVAVGQVAVGRYVLAMFGSGEYVWDMRGTSPIARQFFGMFLN